MNDRFKKLQSNFTEVELLRCDLEAQNRQLTRQNIEYEAIQKELTNQLNNAKRKTLYSTNLSNYYIVEKNRVQSRLDDLLGSQITWEKREEELQIEIKGLKENLKELQTSFDHVR